MPASREQMWSESAMQRLASLWGTMPSTQIGLLLGFSRHAVLKKAGRMHLPPQPSPIIRDGRPNKRKSGRKVEVRRVIDGAIIQLSVDDERRSAIAGPTLGQAPVKLEPVRYVWRPKECCFPLTDGKPWKFCGDPTTAGKDYCASHLQVMYPKRASA